MLVLSTDLDLADARSFAKSHGLEFANVWLPAKAKRAMSVRAMRQARMDRAAIDRALANANEQHEIALRHEVGHTMYAAMYWPGDTVARQVRYGTPAPDWLDEAVAIAMEPAESQARHLEGFIGAVKRNQQAIPDLAAFLASEHPVRSAALAQALARGPKSDSGVQMVVSREQEFAGLDTFYGQSLLTALFLAETSGRPDIIAPISKAIAEGMDFDAWLARDGERHRLPRTVAELDPLWNDWLQQRVLGDGRTRKNGP